MNNYICFIGIIILMTICEFIGQSCLKHFKMNNHKIHYYLYATIFYSIVCYLLLLSYEYKEMGIVDILWSGISMLIIISTGMVFFGDTITNLDRIGICLIIAGIFFILVEGIHPLKLNNATE